MAALLPLSNFRFNHYMSDINQCESFFLQPVCEDKIRSFINNLDTKNTTSPDDIPVLVLKNGRLVIEPWLEKLINESFVLGVFSDVLKMARVTLLFKSPFATIIVQYLYYRTLQKSLKDWCMLGFHSF